MSNEDGVTTLIEGTKTRMITGIDASSESEVLKREIGVGGVFINVINNTIGSGIFLLPAIIAAVLGNASILAYLLCGFLFLLVMLCYAEISSQVTVSGGAYAYIEKAFGPFAGFISNTLFWFGVGVFVMAALVNGVADILSVTFPLFKMLLYRTILFAVIIGVATYINIRGVKQGMAIIKAMTFIKLVPIFLLILLGAFFGDPSNLRWDNFPSFTKIGEVSLVLFFAFAGGECALNVSGEMKNPGRTAPLGLLFGLFGTIVIFCAVQLVAQAVLGRDLGIYTEAPLAEVASKIAGPLGHTVIIAGSVIAILGILNSLPLTFSRVMFAGAKDGLMPRYLAVIHPKFATPANAIISFSVIAFIVAASGGFRQLAVIVSATLLLIYVGVVLATMKFRLANPIKKPGTFRNPCGLTVPVLALLAIAFFIMQLELKELLGVGIFIAALSIVYLLMWLRKKRRDQTATV